MTRIDRIPSIPLIASDPYFSIWMPADDFTSADTVHWAGFEKPVRAGNSGYVDGSIRALVTYAQETYADFASAPVLSLAVGSGLEALAEPCSVN